MNSLIELKNIIASMNKKIRDDDITAFHTRLSHIDRQDDNTDVAPLLKMMRSLGTYLGSKKHKAHADALPLLTSMADQLINIMEAGNPEPGETRQIVSEQMVQYMTLKNKIASRPEVNDIDMQDLNAPVLFLGIPGIHPEQVCGKKACFFTACARPDFQDNVFTVVRILRGKEDLQGIFELFLFSV